MTDSFEDEKREVVSATYYGLGSEFPRELQITLTLEKEEDKTKLALNHAGAQILAKRTLATWNRAGMNPLISSLRASKLLHATVIDYHVCSFMNNIAYLMGRSSVEGEP
jgi:hypothetical protein